MVFSVQSLREECDEEAEEAIPVERERRSAAPQLQRRNEEVLERRVNVKAKKMSRKSESKREAKDSDKISLKDKDTKTTSQALQVVGDSIAQSSKPKPNVPKMTSPDQYVSHFNGKSYSNDASRQEAYQSYLEV